MPSVSSPSGLSSRLSLERGSSYHAPRTTAVRGNDTPARGRTYRGPEPAPHRLHHPLRCRVRDPYQASQGLRRSVRGLIPPLRPRILHGLHTPAGLLFVGRVSSRSGLARLSKRGRRGWSSSGSGRSLKTWLTYL